MAFAPREKNKGYNEKEVKPKLLLDKVVAMCCKAQLIRKTAKRRIHTLLPLFSFIEVETMKFNRYHLGAIFLLSGCPFIAGYLLGRMHSSYLYDM